jgi:predicted nucleic acid-binding protein
MIVVADTSVLCYLVLIEQVELLPHLFGQIAIPQAVFEELGANKAPVQLQKWMTQLPQWLKIYSVTSTDDITLEGLHSGEREAILLAEELKADLIILDEKAARQIARERGLNLTGLLGILDYSATRQLIDLAMVLERLQQTTFRASPRLLRSLRERHQENRL